MRRPTALCLLFFAACASQKSETRPDETTAPPPPQAELTDAGSSPGQAQVAAAPSAVPDAGTAAADGGKPTGVWRTNQEGSMQEAFGLDELTGSMPEGAVRDTVRDHLPEVKACYDKGFRGKDGTIEVKFSISSSGVVRAANVKSSTMNLPKLEKCITQSMLKWKFPKPTGLGVTVTYPFVFRGGVPQL
jgi:TonB family protein